jgi:hypothetical protein
MCEEELDGTLIKNSSFGGDARSISQNKDLVNRSHFELGDSVIPLCKLAPDTCGRCISVNRFWL